jgi:hypothetical protein
MNLNELYDKRNDFFIKENSAVKNAMYALGAIGLAALVYGFIQDPARTWGAILTNNVFFFFISLGGMLLGGMQDCVGATWGRPIKRIHESFGNFFTISASVFIFFLICIKFSLFGAEQVYIWIRDPAMLNDFPGKNVWLTKDFFVVRNIISLLLMIALVRWTKKQTHLADNAFLSGKLSEAEELGSLAKERLRFWSGPILFAHGVIFTFSVTDITMSLSPLWFSTLWGGWSFAVLMQSLLALILILLFFLQKTSFGAFISRSQFHDVGKMLHGFTAFWGYLTFSHILTYWYGNVPEETEYFIHRLHQPWQGIMIAIGIMAFVIPLFALIPKKAKWTFGLSVPIATTIIIAQWLMHLVVVQPEVVKAEKFGLPLVEVGTLLVFTAGFIWAIYSYGRKNMMVSLADPMLKKYFDEKDHH